MTIGRQYNRKKNSKFIRLRTSDSDRFLTSFTLTNHILQTSNFILDFLNCVKTFEKKRSYKRTQFHWIIPRMFFCPFIFRSPRGLEERAGNACSRLTIIVWNINYYSYSTSLAQQQQNATLKCFSFTNRAKSCVFWDW